MVPIYKSESETNTPEFVERERKKYWEYFREAIQADLALKALRPEAEIHWGFDAARHIDAMDQHALKLRGNYLAYFRARLRVLRHEKAYGQVVESCGAVIFKKELNKDDRTEYGEALDTAVCDALSFLKAKITLRSRRLDGEEERYPNWRSWTFSLLGTVRASMLVLAGTYSFRLRGQRAGQPSPWPQHPERIRDRFDAAPAPAVRIPPHSGGCPPAGHARRGALPNVQTRGQSA